MPLLFNPTTKEGRIARHLGYAVAGAFSGGWCFKHDTVRDWSEAYRTRPECWHAAYEDALRRNPKGVRDRLKSLADRVAAKRSRQGYDDTRKKSRRLTLIKFGE